jgi:acyl carrier protein
MDGPEGGGGTTERVLDIVREVLRGKRADVAVGLQDDLFDLGFDSLVIAQVAARVRERLGVDPPLSAYFDAGTVAELGAMVAAAPAVRPEPGR